MIFCSLVEFISSGFVSLCSVLPLFVFCVSLGSITTLWSCFGNLCMKICVFVEVFTVFLQVFVVVLRYFVVLLSLFVAFCVFVVIWHVFVVDYSNLWDFRVS